MSNNKSTRNGYPVEEHNTEELRWIMEECVTRLLRSYYTNKNIQFMMYMFDEGKPPKTWLIAPWMVGDLDLTCHRVW